jgi:hypothetical protein
MFPKPENKWARLLAYVTGLVTQKSLCSRTNTSQPRIGFPEPTFPARMRLSDPERSTLAESGNHSAGLRSSRSPVSPNERLSSPGTGDSLPANLTAPNYVLHQGGPHRTETGSAHCALRQRGNILCRYGIQSAPKRSKNTTWKDFIASHMTVLVGHQLLRRRGAHLARSHDLLHAVLMWNRAGL